MDKEYADQKNKLKQRQIEQERLQKQKLIEEGKTKYNQYINNKNYKLFQLDKFGQPTNCPLKLKREALAELKLKKPHFYRHETLKKIIDGQYWNGKFYGREPNGIWIFLNKDKVIVYPPDKERGSLTEQENKNNNLFYAGLMLIQKIITGDMFICRTCEFSADSFVHDDKDFAVCKFPQNDNESNI